MTDCLPDSHSLTSVPVHLLIPSLAVPLPTVSRLLGLLRTRHSHVTHTGTMALCMARESNELNLIVQSQAASSLALFHSPVTHTHSLSQGKVFLAVVSQEDIGR